MEVHYQHHIVSEKITIIIMNRKTYLRGTNSQKGTILRILHTSNHSIDTLGRCTYNNDRHRMAFHQQSFPEKIEEKLS